MDPGGSDSQLHGITPATARVIAGPRLVRFASNMFINFPICFGDYAGLPMPVIGTTDELDLKHVKSAPNWMVSSDPRFAIDQSRSGSLAPQQHTE